MNWEPLPILPSTIDFVLLTHGHLDHCGYLPKLVADGFKGKIFCSHPTKEITRLILEDSAKIQRRKRLKKANKETYSKHKPAMPLYSVGGRRKFYLIFEWLRKCRSPTY